MQFALQAIVLLLSAADGGIPAQHGLLKVAVAGSEPFVVRQEGRITGISVVVFETAASELHLAHELVMFDSVAAALEAVADGSMDIAVGPITITAERAARVSFTQPYFRSSLGILAPAETPSAWSRMKPLFSRAFLIAVSVLMMVLMLVGTLIWLAERRANPSQFPADPVRGIGNGLWLALVTMTTVGYGDKAPVSLAGRIVTGAWMIISMLTASSLTAGLATAFALTQLPGEAIQTAEQLVGRKVAAVIGTTGEEFARQRGAAVISAASLAAGVDMVLQGRAEAMVFDRPQLAYHLRDGEGARLRLSETHFQPQAYGFATRLEDTVDSRLDIVLLRLQEEGRVRDIARRWLHD